MFYSYKLHYATAYGLGTTRESEGGGEEARRQHHEGKRQAPGKPMSMQCLTTLIYQNVISSTNIYVLGLKFERKKMPLSKSRHFVSEAYNLNIRAGIIEYPRNFKKVT